VDGRGTAGEANVFTLGARRGHGDLFASRQEIWLKWAKSTRLELREYLRFPSALYGYTQFLSAASGCLLIDKDRKY
jgi:hypothetical protein